MKTNILKISLLMAIAGLSSCGGGETNTAPQTSTPVHTLNTKYTGNANQATLTSNNVLYFSGLSINSNNQATNEPVNAVGKIENAAALVVKIPVTDGYSFSLGSGTVTVSSQVNATTGLGMAAMTFNQFVNGGVTMNGVLNLNIETRSGNTSKETITFTNFSVGDAYSSITMDGSVVQERLETSVASTFFTLTMDCVTTMVNGSQVLFDNYVFSGNRVSGGINGEDFSGRIYDSVKGYVTVSTPSSFSHIVYVISLNPSVVELRTPVSGHMILSGANTTSAKVTAGNPSTVIEVDTTGDGSFDYSQTTTWGMI